MRRAIFDVDQNGKLLLHFKLFRYALGQPTIRTALVSVLMQRCVWIDCHAADWVLHAIARLRSDGRSVAVIVVFRMVHCVSLTPGRIIHHELTS